MSTCTASAWLARMAILLACALCACDRGSQSSHHGAELPAPVQPSPAQPGAEGARTPAARAVELCVDPGDVQVEPLDLEALEDEMPAIAPASRLAARLAEMGHVSQMGPSGQSRSVRGTPAPLPGGGAALPLVRCQGNACTAEILALDASGQQRVAAVLPGLGQLDAATSIELVTALADVSSDGAPELWIGYRVGLEGQPGSGYHLAAFALPALTPAWHGTLRWISAQERGHGCDGALYPMDADCDGDGDVVLVQRCGALACLSGEGAGCTGTLTEKLLVALWSPEMGRYEPVTPIVPRDPAQPPASLRAARP